MQEGGGGTSTYDYTTDWVNDDGWRPAQTIDSETSQSSSTVTRTADGSASHNQSWGDSSNGGSDSGSSTWSVTVVEQFSANYSSNLTTVYAADGSSLTTGSQSGSDSASGTADYESEGGWSSQLDYTGSDFSRSESSSGTDTISGADSDNDSQSRSGAERGRKRKGQKAEAPNAGQGQNAAQSRFFRPGTEPKDRPVHPSEIAATAYHVLGINLETRLPGPQNRPMPIVEAQPIKELLA